MTDKEILEMIKAEKLAYLQASISREGGLSSLARSWEDKACDLTVRIDHAHQQQELAQ